MLPKISHPTFPLFVPSLNKAKRFRPYTVKEEKILLMAREATENKEYEQLRAIHQVVTNCAVDELDADELATFDLEWVYLKLRSASVSPTVTHSFIDVEDKEKLGVPEEDLPLYTFTIKLDDVKAPAVSTTLHEVKLSDGSFVTLRHPPASLYLEREFISNPAEEKLIRSTVSVKSQSGEVFSVKDQPRADVLEYFDSYLAEDMSSVLDWFSVTPSMEYVCEYKNSQGNQRKIRLSTLSDFFTY